MEQNLGQLRIRWNLLRITSAGEAVATLLVILLAIPTRWWMVTSPIFILGVVAITLTLVQYKIAWAWLTMLVQAALFTVGLSSTISGINGEAYVPLLLLAFLMGIASDHILNMALNYSGQFSQLGNRAVAEFNVSALKTSLGDLYRRIAWDGVVFGSAFLLSITVAPLGAVGATVAVLSDPSVYVILLSISLAALVMLKEEEQPSK